MAVKNLGHARQQSWVPLFQSLPLVHWPPLEHGVVAVVFGRLNGGQIMLRSFTMQLEWEDRWNKGCGANAQFSGSGCKDPWCGVPTFSWMTCPWSPPSQNKCEWIHSFTVDSRMFACLFVDEFGLGCIRLYLGWLPRIPVYYIYALALLSWNLEPQMSSLERLR